MDSNPQQQVKKAGLWAKETHFDVSAVDHVEGDRVEDELVKDPAEDLAVADPLVEVLLGGLLEQVGDPMQGLVLELDIAL